MFISQKNYCALKLKVFNITLLIHFFQLNLSSFLNSQNTCIQYGGSCVPCFTCLLIHVATSFQTSLSQTHDLSAGICSFEQARNTLELLSKATPRQKVLLVRGFLLIKTLSHVGSGRCCSWEVKLYIIQREKNRCLKKVLDKRGCCLSEVCSSEVLLYF